MLTDHYVEGERSVVMVDESVLGLSPIATAILQAVPDGVTATLRAVTEHVVATFGLPEGPESAEALTEQQIWDLVAHRVLVVVEDERSRDGTSSFTHHRSDSDALEPDGAAAVNALRDALRHLRSNDDRRWAAPDSLSPRGLVSAARQHHVVPYLAANLDRLDIPRQARSELEAAAGRQRAGAAVLAADLSVALAALSNAGVRALAFKGVALATLAYGDFAIRGAGDLDLLVSPRDLPTAHRALSGAGWQPAAGYPTPGPTWAWRHLVRTWSELTLVGANSDVDLHWYLTPTRNTFPEFDILWSRHMVVSVDGHQIPTLSPYDALSHSAGHAAKDGWRWMRSLLDVHSLMSEREAWLLADRPLRPDQLTSVAIAAEMFGVPPDVPPVVGQAASHVDATFMSALRGQQVSTDSRHRPTTVLGLHLLKGLRNLRRTGASPRELVRLLSRSALPPWATAEVRSPYAVVAVPSALRHRLREVAAKIGPSTRPT
ncbi:nucleotidyltransferase family protein [Nocardioides sp. GCM10028917]|uniref:nucleotidyltransferase family protein n=1 Tax=Nocardioides sp. GCM10028917 TaxID=3273408 RepID=UPI00361A123D